MEKPKDRRILRVHQTEEQLKEAQARLAALNALEQNNTDQIAKARSLETDLMRMAEENEIDYRGWSA